MTYGKLLRTYLENVCTQNSSVVRVIYLGVLKRAAWIGEVSMTRYAHAPLSTAVHNNVALLQVQCEQCVSVEQTAA